MMNSGRFRRVRMTACTRSSLRTGSDGAGRRHDDVGALEDAADLRPGDRRSIDPAGERRRGAQRAARHGEFSHVLRTQMRRGGLRHLAGADDERGEAAQLAEDLARQRQRRVADRHGPFADSGLSADPLAGGGRSGTGG